MQGAVDGFVLDPAEKVFISRVGFEHDTGLFAFIVLDKRFTAYRRSGVLTGLMPSSPASDGSAKNNFK